MAAESPGADPPTTVMAGQWLADQVHSQPRTSRAVRAQGNHLPAMGQLPARTGPSPTSGSLNTVCPGFGSLCPASPLSQLLFIPQLPAAMALLWETLALHPRPIWAPMCPRARLAPVSHKSLIPLYPQVHCKIFKHRVRHPCMTPRNLVRSESSMPISRKRKDESASIYPQAQADL